MDEFVKFKKFLQSNVFILMHRANFLDKKIIYGI